MAGTAGACAHARDFTECLPARPDEICAHFLQVAKLRAYHYTAQTKPEKAGLARYGLDLIKGALRNNVEAGVLEPMISKVKIIQVGIQRYRPAHCCVILPHDES